MNSIQTFAPINSILEKGVKKEYLASGATITIVGAGAFGGWTALYLLRAGFRVTLVDAWGPGNARSSSGDETRVIRSTYGANAFYFNLNVRALSLWKENQERFGKQLFHNNGVIWFCYDEQAPIVDDSIAFARQHQMPYEYLTVSEIKKRYQIIHTDDLHHGWLDPHGGYLKAKESCVAVHEAFVKEGGKIIQAHVAPGNIKACRLHNITLHSGESLTADAFVFACGSWLPKIFPEVLSKSITCTKQDVYYFGVPSAFAHSFDKLPVWMDLDGTDYYYGIAGNNFRGFKIGVDKRGEPFDPTQGERVISPDVLAAARKFLSHRFPDLRNAPLLENRVCPYENSPDGNFIFDQHPEADNLWLLGGGSGHGFKHGPALGELVADILMGKKPNELMSIN